MAYSLRIHRLAQADLKAIFHDIASDAGLVAADRYVGGIYAVIRDLMSFPERGTVRPGPVPGLRIIGYRRTASIAFMIDGSQVTILGVFRRGRNVSAEMLEKRL